MAHCFVFMHHHLREEVDIFALIIIFFYPKSNVSLVLVIIEIVQGYDV